MIYGVVLVTIIEDWLCYGSWFDGRWECGESFSINESFEI